MWPFRKRVNIKKEAELAAKILDTPEMREAALNLQKFARKGLPKSGVNIPMPKIKPPRLGASNATFEVTSVFGDGVCAGIPFVITYP